jgi:outer membrane immunogenic protein
MLKFQNRINNDRRDIKVKAINIKMLRSGGDSNFFIASASAAKGGLSYTLFFMQTLKTISLLLLLISSSFAASNSFEGAYVGLTAGYSAAHSEVNTTAFNNAYNGYIQPPAVLVVNQAGVGVINSSSAIGGINGGYNWQVNNWVFGLGLDFNYLNINSTRNITALYEVPLPPSAFTINQNVQANWLVTAGPRIGFTVNRLLMYVTGGLAITELKYNNFFSDNIGNHTYVESNVSDIQYGWTLGAGAEFLLTEKWSVKAEYLYVDFPNISSSSTLTVANPFHPDRLYTNPFTNNANLELNIVRAGINYHF